jgi:hypothetical protein
MSTHPRSSARDFDFLIGDWDTANRRRRDDGVWEEFASTNTVPPHVDGLVQIDHYDAPRFPGRGHVKAITIRAFDETTREWSLVWLSNYAPPDFRPVVGAWDGDEGEFFQTIETQDGTPLGVRFLWWRLGPDRARWAQAFSFDGGASWDENWTMELTRVRRDAPGQGRTR